jgi:peptidyl-prolyl cis-trans isomerase C
MPQSKQIYTPLIAFALGILTTVAVCFAMSMNKMTVDLTIENPINDTIVAKVDGKPIHLKEVNLRLLSINKNIDFGDLNEASKEVIIKDIAAQKLILQEALKNKVHKKSFTSVKSFATLQVQQDYLNSKVEGIVSEKDVRNQYDKLVSSVKGKKEYKIKHILVKEEKDAKDVINYLQDKPFEAAALKFSLDQKSAIRGGDLGGYILEGSINKTFDQQLRSMKEGQISRPFKTNLGWHIVKLEDARDTTPDKYAIAQPKIKNLLNTQEKQKYIQGLIKDSKIEIMPI